MPEMEFWTACVPFCAAASDWRATFADWDALAIISFIASAMLSTAELVSLISRDWISAAASSWVEVCSAASVARRYLGGSVVDAAHQHAQLLDGEVHRVRDGARDVLGHRRLHGQVAVREVAHLVHETQNRILVRAILLLDVFALALGLHGAPARIVTCTP